MLILCCVSGVSSYAQKTVSLKEAVNSSLANHSSAVIYSNKIGIAENQKKDALSEYLPQINGSFAFDYNIKRQTTVFPGAMLGSPTDVEVQFGNKYTGMATLQLDQTIYDQALIYGIKARMRSHRINGDESALGGAVIKPGEVKIFRIKMYSY